MTQEQLSVFSLLQQGISLGSHHSQSRASCKIWVQFARNHFKKLQSSRSNLTSTKRLSSNNLRFTSKISWLESNLRRQLDRGRQTQQVLLVQPRPTTTHGRMGCAAHGWLTRHAQALARQMSIWDCFIWFCLASCFLRRAFNPGLHATVLIQQQNLGITTVLRGLYLGFFAWRPTWTKPKDFTFWRLPLGIDTALMDAVN